MSVHLDQLIARHDRYLVRINRMLAAADRHEPFPEGCEFNEDELSSFDSSCEDTAIHFSGHRPSEGEWLAPVRYAYRHGYAKPDPMSWLKALKVGILRSKSFFEDFRNALPKEVHMHTGDKYEIGTAHVVVGSHATTGNIEAHGDINQSQPTTIDFSSLARELADLRLRLRASTDVADPQADIDIGKIASAEAAAKKGDTNGIRNNLKGVGEWVLDVATKIGVGLAIAALKDAIGTKP